MYPFLRFCVFLLVTCVAFLTLTGCGSKRTIVNALDEKEANEILVFLSSKGIEASKVQEVAGGGGGQKAVLWDIIVDEEKGNEAMSLLNQAGLPRRRGQNLLGIFSNVGLVPSEMQEKIRYQAGLAEQIASTIRKIDGVLDAEVQISFPEENPLDTLHEKKQKITASVYVKHSGVLDDPNSHLITKIKRLVAASVTGLDYDNVTVIADRARYSGQTGIIQSMSSDAEKEYVNIWSVVLAKESVTKFRILFFSFLAIILLLILGLVWLGWKLYPVLEKHGGLKELLHIRPILDQPPAEEEKEKTDTAEVKDENKDDQDTGVT